jgi:hypothetical protein
MEEVSISSLSEDSPLRRRLDRVWDDINIIDYCLEQGFWRFAKRSARIDYSTSIDTSDFGGYQYGFEVPSDAVGDNNIKICADPYFNSPILDCSYEAGFIFCDYQTIYIQYVSNDDSYGSDLTIWPPSFADYVAHEMAFRAVKINSASTTDDNEVEKKRDKAHKIARSKDAMKNPPRFRPSGRWSRSRRGSSTSGMIVQGS